VPGKALQAQKDAFRSQPHRPPALANLSYPGNPRQLTMMLDDYGKDDNLNGWQPWRGRAIISPHIDYPRAAARCTAKVWQRAKTAVLEADLVIILGTDHNGGRGTFTLTRQPYATPYGVLPTDTGLVDERWPPPSAEEAAFAEELHHRKEHSIELSAVWLHYICQQAGIDPKPMVPILCGSFHHFVMNGHHPAEDDLLGTAVTTLQRATADKKVLIVASVDFAHVGPAFGDDYVMDDTPPRRPAPGRPQPGPGHHSRRRRQLLRPDRRRARPQQSVRLLLHLPAAALPASHRRRPGGLRPLPRRRAKPLPRLHSGHSARVIFSHGLHGFSRIR
jgi:AmmeMemoRadiSam system protein B